MGYGNHTVLNARYRGVHTVLNTPQMMGGTGGRPTDKAVSRYPVRVGSEWSSPPTRTAHHGTANLAEVPRPGLNSSSLHRSSFGDRPTFDVSY